MTNSPSVLSEISRRTVGHYNDSAASFWAGTRDHDVSQNIQALTQAVKAQPPAKILDFGCGPGRDLMALKNLGHDPVGLDGSERFCELARQHFGGLVLHQDFLSLDLPSEHFDGIFANASLFHVPSQELPRVLRELWQSLVAGGALFASNPRGDNAEGWNGDRYGAYHDLPAWRGFMNDAGFVELDHYYRPSGRPRAQQPWLASTWRKGA